MDYLKTAIKAAKEAGKIQMEYFGKDLEINTKSNRSDRVTIVDKKCEKKIVEIIRQDFPDHNFLGEEDSYDETESTMMWVIDPLDGTNNFSKNYPFFCVSIALADAGELLVGVVYDPIRDELFTAEKGKGAYLNGKRINVTKTTDLRDSVLNTGFYYDRGQAMEDTLTLIRKFFTNGLLGLRRTGSAALDLCFVACGRLDGFWEFFLSEWDFSAGMLIIREAGGKVTDREGNEKKIEKGYMVASNGLIHKDMIETINS